MTRRKAVSLSLAVVLVLAAGAWYVFLYHNWADKPEHENGSLPAITVEASYPGADAQVVADTVAAPIEQEVNGVEGMMDMVSRSANDGSYTLQIFFQPGTDPNMAQVLVQNRVALAVPKLPWLVQFRGISAKKRQPGVLAIVTLAAKDGRYDALYLSNYANQKIKGELPQGVDVGEVGIIGPHENDPVRDGFARLNGVPIAAVVVWPLRPGQAKDVSTRIEKRLETLRKEFPEGLTLELSFDFAPIIDGAKEAAAADYLLVDVQMPDAASRERTEKVLQRCEELLRKTPGVKDVLSLSADPFDLSNDRACQVVRLASDDKRPRDELIASIRDRFHQEIAEAVVRLRDLSEPRRFPYCAYPIDLAVYDTKALGLDALQREAESLAQRLGQSVKLTDAMAGRASASSPLLVLEIDREHAASLGVSIDDVLKVLQGELGPVHVRDFNQFSRNWEVIVPAGDKFRGQAQMVGQLQVRNKQGQIVPLSKVVRVRDTGGPRAIMRFNMYPMVEITANPAPGVSLAEAREECERIARDTLGQAYRVGWLSQVPSAR